MDGMGSSKWITGVTYRAEGSEKPSPDDRVNCVNQSVWRMGARLIVH